MADEILIEGTKYIPAAEAARIVNLSRDYIARLCKRNILTAKLISTRWYVEPSSLDAYVRAQSFARESYRKQLRVSRAREYAERARQSVVITIPDSNPSPGLEKLPVMRTAPPFLKFAPETLDTEFQKDETAQRTALDERRLSTQRAGTAAAICCLLFFFGAYSLASPGFAPTLYRGASVAIAEIDTITTHAFSSRVAASNSSGNERGAGLAAAVGSVLNTASNTPPLSGLPTSGNDTIATEVQFTGSTVSYGDIVSFDSAKGTYALSDQSNDPNMYGVVVETPALLFEPGDGGIPVARTGSTLINVTLENGPIAAGDKLTSSSIPGKARKAGPGENIIGTANEAFSGAGGVTLDEPNGTPVLAGTISAQVTIGTAAGAPQQESEACSSFFCNLFKGQPPLIYAIARYLVAGLIAAISLVLAFRTFMSDVSYGVISMGRNPLARSSIISMVLFNALLVVVVGGGGLLVSIVILLAG